MADFRDGFLLTPRTFSPTRPVAAREVGIEAQNMVAQKSRSQKPICGALVPAVLTLFVGAHASGCRERDSAPVTTQAPIPAVTRLPIELGKQVLAKVGERTITLADYALVLDRMDRTERLRYQTPDRRRALLDEIINSELLAREAERRGLDKDPVTIAYTDQLFRDEVRRRIRAEIPDPDTLPIDEVQAYYAQHRDDFRSPELRRAAMIALPNEAAANQVLAELGNKSSVAQWNTVAIRSSVERSESALPIDVVGDVGLVAAPPRGDTPVPGAARVEDGIVDGASRVPSEVRAAVYALHTPGEVHPAPVTAAGKWYVVRLVAINPARTLSQEEADSQIRARLVNQRLDSKYAALERQLAELGANAGEGPERK